MTLRFARLALLAPLAALFLTHPVAAQKAETPPAGEVKVALDTSAGRIVLALDPVHAPVTTANFLKYVDGGRFNGESFYRAMKFGDGGLIQAGVTSNARKLLPPIKHEPVSETGIKHVAGTVAMANLGPGTARADFFILTSDAPSFNDTFAAFGKVVEGMDVAKSILASPVSATKGEGIMRGQMLDPVVKITKASRLAN
jgi:peptidyl-prolyl cis-trans isomerase A (cyclophilin A)